MFLSTASHPRCRFTRIKKGPLSRDQRLTLPQLFSLGPPLSDFLNSPAPVAPTAKASLQRSSVAAPGTRSVGAPLKRPVSEIEGTSAKLIDKKIKPNRPAAAAAYLTNRNRNKTGQNSINNSNGRNSDDLLQPSNKQKLQNAKAAVARDLRTPGEIFFVRSRMFYSKPAYNAHGEVLFGLRHIRTLMLSSVFFSPVKLLFCFPNVAVNMPHGVTCTCKHLAFSRVCKFRVLLSEPGYTSSPSTNIPNRLLNYHPQCFALASLLPRFCIRCTKKIP